VSLYVSDRGKSNILRMLGGAAPLRPHLIACGLSGEPVPPVMISGAPQKKNS
jgi:hypothetical protein